ncbi:MAG: tRNA (adenosine(37)-N6)-dimethylallyltransferase MiaA [Clostridia bacterium]|nr:tRNA (adenosine(37)-N6)-dimethylallyltransferase MiaA [Clostridia bacterium]
MRPRALFLVGPTGSGKTTISIAIAKSLNCEVVSADSIQVYRGMDIGSAKPTDDEMAGIPHYMLDCVDIDDTAFSVAEYSRNALECIAYIERREKLPLVVGGTGLYINSLTYPLNFSGVTPDPELRAMLLESEGAQRGSLHARLRALDPKSAARLHPNDTKRIVRALEICILSGKPMSEQCDDFRNERGNQSPCMPVMAGLTMSREMLYSRINERVETMLERGLLDEVRGIMERGHSPKLPALQALGYKQLIAHLNGEYDLPTAIELIKRETRRFAKRQITWFKRDTRIEWFDAGGGEASVAREITQYYEKRLAALKETRL